MNLSKPTADKPALLRLGEVETFLHEFGHSLHGIFANSRFESLSGTNVWWDFVELPSQFMENFVIEKDFLRTFAFHYQTGEPMPDELIEKSYAAATTEQPQRAYVRFLSDCSIWHITLKRRVQGRHYSLRERRMERCYNRQATQRHLHDCAVLAHNGRRICRRILQL